MAAFFAQWALWEKMTFCLGLAIVIAVVLGFAKNFYSRWKLRNYATVEARLLDPTPAMIEGLITGKADAPFGTRALERGLEIEGVWISRSNLNTPNASRPQSPTGSTSSSFLDEPTTPSWAIIDKARARVESTQSSVPSWYAPSKRVSDAESTASWTIDTNGFKQLDVYRPQPLLSQATSRPHHSIQSDGSVLSDDSAADGYLRRTLTVSSDDNGKPHSASTMATSPAASIDGSEQSKVSTDSAVGMMRPYDANNMITVGREPKADLGLLYTHRLSHVAETGQLVPRSKRSPRASGDWTRTAPAKAPRSRHPPISMHNRKVSRSLPTTPVDEKQDPFNLPPPADRRSSLPNTQQQAPTPPEHKTACVTVQTTTEPEQDGEIDEVENIVKFYEKHNGAISAIASLARPETAYDPTTFENDRNSDVLRKVNDSLEILQPGISTTQKTEPTTHTMSRDRSKKQARRLSKERPAAGSRDCNSFIEVLYGNERKPRF